MSGKLNYGFDIDGTLCTIDSALEAFNKITKREITLPTMLSYHFAEIYNLSKEEEISIWKEQTKDIILNSEPNVKIVDYLKSLKSKGHKITIVTARPVEYLGVTKYWLEKQGIKYDALYMGQSDKFDVLHSEKVVQFLDDKGELIENLMNTPLAETCELTIVDAPYNRNFKSHSRI